LHRVDLVLPQEAAGVPIWESTIENNRRAKYYRLTKAGEKQLEAEGKRWGRISWAIAQALEAS
jgi:PadR family transcriptional regulator